jgi:hypothetical protein
LQPEGSQGFLRKAHLKTIALVPNMLGLSIGFSTAQEDVQCYAEKGSICQTEHAFFWHRGAVLLTNKQPKRLHNRFNLEQKTKGQDCGLSDPCGSVALPLWKGAIYSHYKCLKLYLASANSSQNVFPMTT